MIKDKIKPSIRFPGFEDDWEQRKLGELVSFSGGHTPSMSNPDNYDENGHMWITSQDVKSTFLTTSTSKLSDEGVAELKQFKPETLVMVVRSGILRHTLPIAMLLETSAVNQDIKALEVLGGDSSYWLLYALKAMEKFLLRNFSKTGTTVESMDAPKLKDVPINVPSREEQTQIAKLFLRLDDTITLHQRKLDDLKELKSGLLQKMFPQKGEKVPQVRFPGFTGDWEQRKLSDIAQITAGGTPSTSEPDYWDGKVDWYSPSEIGTATYATGSERKITKLGVEKSSAKILPADRTILFTSRASIGDMAILKKDGCTNQGFQSLVLNEGIDTYFVYSSGFRIKEYALKNAAGSTFLEISGKQLGKMDFSIPSPEEQKEIGDFFKNLDETITLHQKKIDDLNQLKSGLLQKMFP